MNDLSDRCRDMQGHAPLIEEVVEAFQNGFEAVVARSWHRRPLQQARLLLERTIEQPVMVRTYVAKVHEALYPVGEYLIRGYTELFGDRRFDGTFQALEDA